MPTPVQNYLVLITLAIAAYIIYRLWVLRTTMQSAREAVVLPSSVVTEGFDSQLSDMDTNGSATKPRTQPSQEDRPAVAPVAIGNKTTKPPMNKPLYKYAVKSAYNACLTKTLLGNYKVSVDALASVLSQGYRMIDLELIYAEDTENSALIPKVSAAISYGGDPTSSPVNAIPFTDVLETLLVSGLLLDSSNGGGGGGTSTRTSATKAPNPKEPLFLHLRIKPTEDAAQMHTFFKSIYDAITNPTPIAKLIFANFLFPAQMMNNTVTPEFIMGKQKPVVLVIDQTSFGEQHFETYKHSRLRKELETLSSGFLENDSSPSAARNPKRNGGIEVGMFDLQTPRKDWSKPAIANVYLGMALHTVHDATENTAVPYFDNTLNDPVGILRDHRVHFAMVNAHVADENTQTYRNLFAADSGFQTLRWIREFGSQRRVVKNTKTAFIIGGAVVGGVALCVILMTMLFDGSESMPGTSGAFKSPTPSLFSSKKMRKA